MTPAARAVLLVLVASCTSAASPGAGAFTIAEKSWSGIATFTHSGVAGGSTTDAAGYNASVSITLSGEPSPAAGGVWGANVVLGSCAGNGQEVASGNGLARGSIALSHDIHGAVNSYDMEVNAVSDGPGKPADGGHLNATCSSTGQSRSLLLGELGRSPSGICEKVGGASVSSSGITESWTCQIGDGGKTVSGSATFDDPGSNVHEAREWRFTLLPDSNHNGVPDVHEGGDQACHPAYNSFDWKGNLVGTTSTIVTFHVGVPWCHGPNGARLRAAASADGDLPVGVVSGALEHLVGLSWRYRASELEPSDVGAAGNTLKDYFAVTARPHFDACLDFLTLLAWLPGGKAVSAVFKRAPRAARQRVFATVVAPFIAAAIDTAKWSIESLVRLAEVQKEGLVHIIHLLAQKASVHLRADGFTFCNGPLGFNPIVTVTLRSSGAYTASAATNIPYLIVAQRIFDSP